MDPKTIDAIMTALKDGQRVELMLTRDGTLEIRTVTRKRLKVNIEPTA